jgi:hypothetical protein
MSAKEIINGWKNTVLKDPEVEKLAEVRLAICKECPKQSDNARKNGYKSARLDVHCTECSCPLIAKTRSTLSKCPLNKW